MICNDFLADEFNFQSSSAEIKKTSTTPVQTSVVKFATNNVEEDSSSGK